jgi:cation diffusion facilitator CzcD-associated flavoprotein CzcO
MPAATRRNGRAWKVFKGRIVHPQEWPADQVLDGKRVVVIGSGATAATLIPAIADRCAHVTMLQRSPTFFITGRNANDLANTLRQLDIPNEWTHEIVRRKVLFDQTAFTRRCVAEPEVVRQELLAGVRAALGPGFEGEVEKHFNPRYRPWQQRIAFVPDADLFKSIREGKASVVTDQVEAFTEGGIRLQSGQVLDADVVVSATGFNLSVLGDIRFAIDGESLDFAKTVGWRGAMFTGVPNMAWVFGYFRASWTLRADLLAEFVCRLPSAQAHGCQGRAGGDAGAARDRSGPGAAALGGAGQLQSRLPGAWHRAAAAAGRA